MNPIDIIYAKRNQQTVSTCLRCGTIYVVLNTPYMVKRNLKMKGFYCPVCGEKVKEKK